MIAFNSRALTTQDGRPLYGRVYFFNKDTNQMDNIFKYNQLNQLVPAANPQYTNAEGFIEDDVILSDKIYTIYQEEYIGDMVDYKTDEEPSHWKADRNYYEGIGIPKPEIEEHIVFTLAALQAASTDFDKVTVIGYNTPFDCEPRTYIYDATAVDNVDYGQVVDSISDGRWILLNDKPYVPSTYYGVYAGNLQNINRFMARANAIGTNGAVKTPDVNYFTDGTYNITQNITTVHSIMLGSAIFPENFSVSCHKLIVNKSAKGKFKYVDVSTPADSDNFYNFEDLFACGSNNIIVRADTSTYTDVLDDFSIHNKIITFENNAQCLTTAKITFNNCVLNGSKFIDSGIFRNMEFTDKYLIDTNANIISMIDATCSFDINKFIDKSNYLTCMVYVGNTDIDLIGNTIDYTLVNDIDLTLRNANGKLKTQTYDSLIKLYDSNLELTTEASGVSAEAYNSILSTQGSFSDVNLIYSNTNNIVNTDTLRMNHSSVYGAQAANSIYMTNGSIGSFETTYLSAYNSRLEKDFWVHDNGHSINADIMNCSINGFQIIDGASGNDIQVRCKWLNNTYTTTSDICMTVTAQNYLASAASAHSYEYKGNNGAFSTDYNTYDYFEWLNNETDKTITANILSFGEGDIYRLKFEAYASEMTPQGHILAMFTPALSAARNDPNNYFHTEFTMPIFYLDQYYNVTIENLSRR